MDFYTKRSYALTRENNREIIFNYVKKQFSKHAVFKIKYNKIFKGGFKDFNFWFSVIQTRTHAIKNEIWANMYGCESAELCDGWSSNALLQPDPPYIIVPLCGLTNHR
jgi:hypothetical protein